jgi:hypothetical protein
VIFLQFKTAKFTGEVILFLHFEEAWIVLMHSVNQNYSTPLGLHENIKFSGSVKFLNDHFLSSISSIYDSKKMVSCRKINFFLSCENPKFFNWSSGRIRTFYDKKVIFDEKLISFGPPAPSAIYHQPYVSKFCNLHNFFPFNLDTSLFQV